MAFWVLLSAYFVHTSAPLLYHAYTLFPCYFWGVVLGDYQVWVKPLASLVRDVRTTGTSLLSATLYIGALELLVRRGEHTHGH